MDTMKKLENARETEKKLKKMLKDLNETLKLYDNETDNETKAFLETLYKRNDSLEKRLEIVGKGIVSLVSKLHANGLSVSGILDRAQDILNKSTVSINDLDQESDFEEKGRKTKLSFEDLKNVIRVTLPIETWAKCFCVNDYLYFSNRENKDSKNVNITRRFAIRQIIAETQGNWMEVNRIEIERQQSKEKNRARNAKK